MYNSSGCRCKRAKNTTATSVSDPDEPGFNGVTGLGSEKAKMTPKKKIKEKKYHVLK
jgi:hypothetical protein